MLTQHDEVIHTQRAYNPRYAAIDAQNRSAEALKVHKKRFMNPSHSDTVQKVLDIVKGFFTVNAGVYVNHRFGKNRPFTVVKVAACRWPTVSNKDADDKYRTPLAAMGIVPVFSKNTNSYLYRVYA